MTRETSRPPAAPASDPAPDGGRGDPLEGRGSSAWRHILIAEGSDWFWWFGEHHHTELDHVWDLEFRHHLQEVYRCLGEPVPIRLYLPVLTDGPATRPASPTGTIEPVIDGRLEERGRLGRRGVAARPIIRRPCSGPTGRASSRRGLDGEPSISICC